MAVEEDPSVGLESATWRVLFMKKSDESILFVFQSFPEHVEKSHFVLLKEGERDKRGKYLTRVMMGVAGFDFV